MLLLFILGTLIGSFLNVVIFRTPNNQSIIKPRSHCPNCKKMIPFYHNIPIISFVLLKGRCHNRSKKISMQYIVVEIITGFLFIIAFYNSSITDGILLSIVFSCLIIISYIDYYYLLIPSIILYLLLILIIPFSVINGQSAFQIIIGGGSVSIYLLVCTLIVGFFKKEMNIIGYGDILLIIFIGSWLGVVHSFICLFIAAIIGLLYIIINNIVNNKKILKIPFGTCLSISFILITILKKYTSLSIFQ